MPDLNNVFYRPLILPKIQSSVLLVVIYLEGPTHMTNIIEKKFFGRDRFENCGFCA